jgi:hypothetical protein
MIATLMVLSLAFGGLAVLAGAVVADRARPKGPPSWLDDLEAERLIVITTEGKTFEGNLMAVASDGLILTAAQLRDGEQHPLAGDVFIPREKIRLVQRPGVTS